jgi:hypothetical protein
VAGKGFLRIFTLWGHNFVEQSVRVMENLPSKVLIGSEFWRKHALKFDLQHLCGDIAVDGQNYRGPVSTNKEGDLEVAQQVHQILRDQDKCETEEPEKAIKSMDLTSFSEDSENLDSLRSLFWEFNYIFLGMELVNDVEHKI